MHALCKRLLSVSLTEDTYDGDQISQLQSRVQIPISSNSNTSNEGRPFYAVNIGAMYFPPSHFLPFILCPSLVLDCANASTIGNHFDRN